MTPSPQSFRDRVPGWVLWTAGTALLATFLLACDMASGVYPVDSDWFLELLDRVAHGDALYADRFYGVMPISVWAGLPGVLLVGPQIVVVKGMYAVSSACAAIFAVYAARRLRVGPAGQGLILLASVSYLAIPSYTPYKPMAYAAQVGALAAMAAWLRMPSGRGGDWRLLLAGAAVGISVASKHTVGAATLAACLVVVLFVPPVSREPGRVRLRRAALVLVPALAVPLLSLLPVLIAGDLDAFWRYVVTKGEYVDRGSISYLNGFTALRDLWGLPPSNLHFFLIALGNCAAPLALLGLVATMRRQGEWLLLASFTVVAIASSYPRADLLVIVPVLSVAITWSLRQLTAGRLGAGARRVPLALVAALLVATAYATLLRPAYIAIRDGYSIGGMENHAGVPVPPEMVRAAGEVGGELASVDAGQNRTFVLSPFAGFIYLASHTHDPTRQDLPYATTFRGDERAQLERRIASGEISRVCLGPYKGSGNVRPWALESYVRTRLNRSVRVGPPADSAFGYLGCRIYRSPAAG